MSTRSPKRRRAAAQHTPRPAAARPPLQVLPAPAAPGPAVSLAKPVLVRLVKPLPHRPAADRRAALEAAAVHAAYAATAGRITALVSGWRAAPGGGVQQHLADGTLLRHDGTTGAPFTAVVTCPYGAAHTLPVATAQALDAARRAADGCQQPHTDLKHLTAPTPTERFRSGQQHAVRTLQQAKGLALMPGCSGSVADLRSAESELQHLRGRLALVAAFIHDDAYDLGARTALAQLLQLPAPRTAPWKETADVR